MCPLLVKSAGQSRNDERQNENTGKSGAENCLLLLFFELKRKFVQETWFLEVPFSWFGAFYGQLCSQRCDWQTDRFVRRRIVDHWVYGHGLEKYNCMGAKLDS